MDTKLICGDCLEVMKTFETEKLAEDHIISWSNEGDTILDPFSGSGTTGKMAKIPNRNFIGIDIGQEYIELATKRIN